MNLIEEMKLAQTGITLVKQVSADLKAARADGHVTVAEAFKIFVRAGETVLTSDPAIGAVHLLKRKGSTS